MRALILLLTVVLLPLTGAETPAPATPVAPAAPAEQPGVPTPAAVAPPVAEPKPIPSRPASQRFVIGNAVAEVELSDWRASIARFALKTSHPIRLPKWRGGSETHDPKAPLDVLALFNDPSATRSFTDMHNYLARAELEDGTTRIETTQADGSITSVTTEGPLEPPWQVAQRDAASVTFVHVDAVKNLAYSLVYHMDEKRPTVHVRLLIENRGAAPVELNPGLVAINGIHQDDPRNDAAWMKAVAHFDRRSSGDDGTFDSWSMPDTGFAHRKVLAHPKLENSTVPVERVDYVGMVSRFFAALWAPEQCRIIDPKSGGAVEAAAQPTRRSFDEDQPAGGSTTAATGAGLKAELQSFDQRFGSEQARQGMVRLSFHGPQNSAFSVPPGQALELAWNLTVFGMKKDDLALLDKHERKTEYTDGYYRFFRILSVALTFVLDIFQKVVVNYGVAVLLLTLLVKALLHRANFKQQESILKMQKLSPELKRLQDQYRNDRQTLGLKQMELFKKHQVNPLGGCLPILVQMPIFIALYQTFGHSAAMRGHSFLWVNDLTLPDQLIYLGFSLPWLGPATLNILPILYIGVSLWMSMSYKMPENATEQQQQMAKMMKWMPIMFGVFFYNMPAGLVLYFTFSAIIGTLEIKYIRRKLGMA